MTDPQCHFCGASVVVRDVVSREDECGACRHDLRSCVNCRHYDTRYNNSCRETMADVVEDKQRRNFCEYFAFNPEPHRAPQQGARAGDARAKLDALFGGKPSAPSSSTDARTRLDALFKKKDAGPDNG